MEAVDVSVTPETYRGPEWLRRGNSWTSYPHRVPDTLSGLPLHPLVVHAAVVLVPLAALGAILMAFLPRFSRRFGPLVVVVSVVAAASAWLARVTGGTLNETVSVSEEHAEWGHQMPVAAVALALLTVVFWLFDRGVPSNRSRAWWLKALALLVVLVSVVAVYLTVVAGHSGAEAVWASRLSTG